MTKIFLSDLHIGDGSKADDFNRDYALLKLFEKYSNSETKIVLLGDIFELWQADLDKIMWYHPGVCKCIFRYANIIMVFGNHDYLPFARWVSETYEDDRVFAQHGHQHDIFNRYRNPLFSLKWPIGKYITLLIGQLERLWHPDIDDWLRHLKNKHGDFLYKAAELQSAKKSDIILSEYPNKQIIIEGHSHQALLIEYAADNEWNSKIYANCGAWVDGVRPTYIQVNDDTVQLRDGLDYSVIKEVKI